MAASDAIAARRRRYRALWRLPYLCGLLSKQPKLPGAKEQLPQDPRLTAGRLPCGVRYFVYVNRKPRLRAVLKLIVRVGSLVEDEDQLGVAHLMEHMVFRGTPSFPVGDLKRFVERCGMSWGADLNAETSAESTVYTLEVPLKVPATAKSTGLRNKKSSGTEISTTLLETGLKVLREFAFEALLRSEDVQIEKAIVEEEWRCRLGADQRMEERFWKTAFCGCRHACRLPIGCMETLRKCPDERLRDFYRTWYRPENMSIVVVGDFPNNTFAVDLLEKAFEGAAPQPSPQPRSLFDSPLQAVVRTAIAHRDEEFSACVVRLRLFSSDSPTLTQEDIAADVARDLAVLVINRRLTALQGREASPFLSGVASEEHFTQTYRCMQLLATALEGKLRATARSLAELAASFAAHGATEHELNLVKSIHAAALDSAWKERHHAETDDVVDAIEDHVFWGERSRLCDEALYLRLQRAALKSLDRDAIHAAAKQLFGMHNGHWVVEAEVLEAEEPEIDAETLKEIVLSVERASDIPPFAWQPGETLDTVKDVADIACDASVMERHALEHGHHWTLSNGATVTWLRTDFEPDEILIHGMAVGGTSELDTAAQRAAAGSLGAMTRLCGLNGLTRSQLGEHLAGVNCSVGPSVSGYSRHLDGRSTSRARDFHMALRLASWHFAPPTFTQSSFTKVLDACRERIANREREPEYHLQKKLQELICGDNPFFQDLTMDDVAALEKIGIDGLAKLYAEMFGSPGEWSWVLVGALPDDEVAFGEMLARHLGGSCTRSTARLPTWTGPRPVVPKFSPGQHARVHFGVSETATVCMCFAVEARHFDVAARRLAAAWLTQIVETRLIDRLRIAEGATYGVSCSMAFGSVELRLKDKHPTLSIQFSCEPALVDKCKGFIDEELQELVGARPVTPDELESCRERSREQLRVDERENGRWLGQLELAVRKVRCRAAEEGVSMDAAPSPQVLVPMAELEAMLKISALRNQRVEEIQLGDVQTLGPCLFPQDAFVSVALLPASSKGEVSAAAKRQRTA